jgi:hypothetical protein
MAPEQKNPSIDMLFTATLHRSLIKIPIGETLIIGSFGEHVSSIDIVLKKAPTTKTLLMIRPTKVEGLEWTKPPFTLMPFELKDR